MQRRLHRLVDRVPEGEVRAAEPFLEYLDSADDPLRHALMIAPEDDEPLSDDREALEEGRRALDASDVVSHEALRKAIGGDGRSSRAQPAPAGRAVT